MMNKFVGSFFGVVLGLTCCFGQIRLPTIPSAIRPSNDLNGNFKADVEGAINDAHGDLMYGKYRLYGQREFLKYIFRNPTLANVFSQWVWGGLKLKWKMCSTYEKYLIVKQLKQLDAYLVEDNFRREIEYLKDHSSIFAYSSHKDYWDGNYKTDRPLPWSLQSNYRDLEAFVFRRIYYDRVDIALVRNIIKKALDDFEMPEDGNYVEIINRGHGKVSFGLKNGQENGLWIWRKKDDNTGDWVTDHREEYAQGVRVGRWYGVDYHGLLSYEIVYAQGKPKTLKEYTYEHKYIGNSYKITHTYLAKVDIPARSIEVFVYEGTGAVDGNLITRYGNKELQYWNIYESVEIAKAKLNTATPPADKFNCSGNYTKNEANDLYGKTQRTGKDFALIITANDYTEWADLQTPNADGRSLSYILKDLYGFNVDVINNPTKSKFQEKLNSYLSKSFDPEAQLLIFISGHGSFNEETGEGYFIVSDSKREDENGDSYINYNDLRAVLDKIPCKHILVVIDACYSGYFELLSAKGSPFEKTREYFFKSYIDRVSRVAITSAGKEPSPQGDEHSPLTCSLLGLLGKKGGEDAMVTYKEILFHLEKLNPQPRGSHFGQSNIDFQNFILIPKYK